MLAFFAHEPRNEVRIVATIPEEGNATASCQIADEKKLVALKAGVIVPGQARQLVDDFSFTHVQKVPAVL